MIQLKPFDCLWWCETAENPCSAPQTPMRRIISSSSLLLRFNLSWWKRKWTGSESIRVFLFTSDTSKLLIMAFVCLVDFPLRGIYITSLAQWGAASAPCHLFIWIIDLSELINILWVNWVSSCALQCSHENWRLVKILTWGVFHTLSKPRAKSFVQASFINCTHSAHIWRP